MRPDSSQGFHRNCYTAVSIWTSRLVLFWATHDTYSTVVNATSKATTDEKISIGISPPWDTLINTSRFYEMKQSINTRPTVVGTKY